MMNPVLRREAITTMRGWKSFGIICFYLLVVSGGALMYYIGGTRWSQFTFDPRIMVYLYALLAGLQFALVMISVPAQTAGSISGERERQTLDLLLVTKMSTPSIIIGKLLASMAFTLLTIFATLPVFGIVFYFGGTTVVDLLTVMAFILSVAFMLGAISIFFSCLYKRTVICIMLVYMIIGVLLIGTIIAAVLPEIVSASNGTYKEPSIWHLVATFAINPGAGFFSLMDKQVGFGIVSGALGYYVTNNNSLQAWAISNLWVLNMAFNIIVGVIFIFFSALRINPMRTPQKQKPQKAEGAEGGKLSRSQKKMQKKTQKLEQKEQKKALKTQRKEEKKNKQGS